MRRGCSARVESAASSQPLSQRERGASRRMCRVFSRETWVTAVWSWHTLPEINLAHDLVDEYHLEHAIRRRRRRRRAEGHPLARQSTPDKQAAALQADLADASNLEHSVAGRSRYPATASGSCAGWAGSARSEADSRVASEVDTALRATSSTAVVISVTVVAASWISSCCCNWRPVFFSVPWLIRSAALANWRD